MCRNFLGISAGLALGAALFSAPASASLVLGADSGGNIGVGNVDRFVGSCSVNDTTLAGTGGGIEKEIDCLNRELLHDSIINGTDPIGVFLTTDAFKIETLNFQEVIDASNTYAQKLTDLEGNPILGGWFSIKTGNNITCVDTAPSFGITHCVDGGLFLIFENLTSLLYAVVDLNLLLNEYGINMDGDIARFSHITIVPLPGAALLFGSALLGGGLMRRRKRARETGGPAAG